MVPDDLDQKASRLLRDRWASPTELAQELYAIFKSGSRRSLLADEEPAAGGGPAAAVAEPSSIVGSSTALDLGGVGRSVVPLRGLVQAGGMGRRRIQPFEPDIARPRSMPGEADAARPRRPFDQPDPFKPAEFPPTEPARTRAELGEIAARFGITLPELDTGARPAPLGRRAPSEGPTRPTGVSEPAARQRPTRATEEPLERPGFSRPEARTLPPSPIKVPEPAAPAQAREAAAAIAAPTAPVRRPMVWDASSPKPIPQIASTPLITYQEDQLPTPQGHQIWIGVVVSGTGNEYQVDLYPNGMTGSPGSEVTVHIPQIDDSETIPEGTVLGCIHDYGTGYYECQVPIWLD